MILFPKMDVSFRTIKFVKEGLRLYGVGKPLKQKRVVKRQRERKFNIVGSTSINSFLRLKSNTQALIINLWINFNLVTRKTRFELRFVNFVLKYQYACTVNNFNHTYINHISGFCAAMANPYAHSQIDNNHSSP